jgi:transcriptional regulator with PAS, ATPase and Fis domain
MLEMTSGPKASQKIMATGTPVFDENGDIEQVVVNVRDITELENLKKQLDDIRHYASELQEMHIQQFKMDDIVAQSPAMQRILELVTRVSRVESTVLITGESGVGKEVIAKKIHLLSKRQNKPLIKINCGAIPENLLESELFGYEGGAFTGARKEGKPGMFELASEGTLFLDEIGELPLNLQVKLLRAIQEKEIIRVGGLKAIPVDVRIIAATNKDLASMVRKGTFREDLFYRLNVVNINIPPLRQRREDIIPLLFEVLKKFNAKYGLDKKLTGPVVERLLQYDWPGNVRELENLVERLVVLVNEPHVQVMHLPEFLQENRAKSKAITVNGIVPLKTAIEDVEAQLIEHALKEHRTTRKVAQLLEVNQSTIVRKIKYYNICREDAQENQNEVWVHQIRI